MTKFLAIFSLVIIVLLAFAACGEESTPTPAPAAQAIEAEVQRSVAAALADQSADSIREDAMSTEDMSALVQEAIGAQAPEGISPEQVQSAIERAVSEAPQGLSESDLQAAVAEALDQATMASEEPAMMMGAQAAATPASTPAPPATAAPRVTAIPTPAPTATPAYRAPSTPAPTPGSNLLVAGPPVPTATAVPASRSTGTPTPPPSPATVGTPSATTFQDYLRERFVSTAADAVSTFSLDTDWTSYYLALNWARAGYEVEPDSVRAGEWINAFDYQYDPPLRNDSFSISSDVFRPRRWTTMPRRST